jgi:hypothetical protein
MSKSKQFICYKDIKLKDGKEMTLTVSKEKGSIVIEGNGYRHPLHPSMKGVPMDKALDAEISLAWDGAVVLNTRRA